MLTSHIFGAYLGGVVGAREASRLSKLLRYRYDNRNCPLGPGVLFYCLVFLPFGVSSFQEFELLNSIEGNKPTSISALLARDYADFRILQ